MTMTRTQTIDEIKTVMAYLTESCGGYPVCLDEAIRMLTEDGQKLEKIEEYTRGILSSGSGRPRKLDEGTGSGKYPDDLRSWHPVILQFPYRCGNPIDRLYRIRYDYIRFYRKGVSQWT